MIQNEFSTMDDTNDKPHQHQQHRPPSAARTSRSPPSPPTAAAGGTAPSAGRSHPDLDEPAAKLRLFEDSSVSRRQSDVSFLPPPPTASSSTHDIAICCHGDAGCFHGNDDRFGDYAVGGAADSAGGAGMEPEIADMQRDCGIGLWRPECLQRCANIKCFILVISILSMLSGMLSTGYLNSVITTIEKRFEIGSSISGLIAASYEFGSLVAVVFVSYLGGRRHIPLWLGLGVVFMAIGAMMFSLPHIIAETYTVRGGISNKTDDDDMCRAHHAIGGAAADGDKYGLYSDEQCIAENSGNAVHVFLLILAQILLGTGGTPIYTLGTTYIDNHIAKERAPAYIAFMYATGALGPVLGFALGALMLQFYVDSFVYDYTQLNIQPLHPRWVGCWWGGFIICGLLLLVTSTPFFAFPKVLQCEKDKLMKERVSTEENLSVHELERRMNYGKTIKDIPQSVYRLLRNPVYLITTLGICCEVSIASGFVVFLPKYLETQFGISNSLANLLTGLIAIPGAVVGIMIGGLVLNKFQLGPKGGIQLTLLLNVLSLMGFSVLFFLGCDNMKLAGATLPYYNSSGHVIEAANLTAMCNLDCDCSPNQVSLVCGVNSITYFSPCYAGCTNFYNAPIIEGVTYPVNKNYSDCSCILPDDSTMSAAPVFMAPIATSGPCLNSCGTLLPFMITLFVMTFMVAGTQMPLIMVTLRSVAEEEKAFALGLQFVVMRLLANIPSPIIFGKTIDSTCLHWKIQCNSAGACLIYDIEQFRYKYIGVSTVLKMTGIILFCSDWLLIKQRNESATYNLEPHNMVATASEPNISLAAVTPGGANGDEQTDELHRDQTQESFVSWNTTV
ncbi:solute carrier organic anion transporter family member 5A1-like [Tubulanus polymorphus]|uniref:solute carrier organic anion transporter family member 5A1-like n=1 Tax=Tubulanus polymorphus TaxID=672921 RepID=UPI003DA468FE